MIKLLERRGPAVFGRDAEGCRKEISRDLMASETALDAFDEPQAFPEIHSLRRLMLDWRFYHNIRTDPGSLLRRPCLAVTSSTLASDGSNFASVLATLTHIRGDTVDLNRAIEDAFPGASLAVPLPEHGASFGMIFPDHPRRVFTVFELSAGTLHYLTLAGALLGMRACLRRAERTRKQPILRLAGAVGPADRVDFRADASLVGHPLRTPRHGAAAPRGVQPKTVVKRNGETWIDGLRITGSFASDEPE